MHILRVVFALAMVVALAIPADAQVPGVSSDEIVIGTFGPVTGPVYIYGQLAMNGIDVVFEKVNKEGGIHGRKLRLVREDDRCRPEGAIAAVRRLAYSHKVFAILGGACTAATIAAKPEIVRSEVPTVINVAVGDSISHPPEKNIYSVIVTASLESHGQLQFAREKGAKVIGVVAQHDAWGTPRYGPLVEAFQKAGIKPVVDEKIADDANDATPQVLRLKAAGVDSVIMLARPKAAAVLLRDAAKVGFKPTWWIGQTAVQDLDAFEKQVGLPGGLDNFVTISYMKYQPNDPEVADWRERLQALFPYDNLSPFSLAGIASGLVLVEALKRAGPDLTRDKFLQTMGSLKGFDTGLLPGPITCNPPASHQCNRGFAWIRKTGDGKIQTIATTVVK
jgi:branched-chain amino acid transport system substrate-binding protein